MNQVRTLQHPGGIPPDTRWIVLLEDDVYVNLARLFYFLAGHSSKDDHAVMFTHAVRLQDMLTLRGTFYLLAAS